ncbi:MAG: phosphate transport system regulatory protein PhoU [Paenibacillaceae bacterium]|jgi:phosphate transport system protein|nr:phosphate transport system regulatory protein PhoU [Paenibacillaceae bacterium]
MNHRTHLEEALKEIQSLLLEMGKRVEVAIDQSILSLKVKNMLIAQQVIDEDPKLNELEMRIIDLGAKTIATQQPISKDMRKILSAFRIASDLERMGDLAVDVAKVTIRIGDQELIKPLVDIPRMADLTKTMVVESMEAYVQENIELAYKMASIDDEVDALYSQILRELFIFMLENPTTINQGMLLCFVGRYLERIADHATNIGENVVYLVKGVRPELN